MEQKKLIEFRNIVKSFDGQVILKGINLDIYENEFVTLLGPSGCGKTTLLRILGGFLDTDEGKVVFDGEVINDKPPYERELNTVFQKYALFPHLSVYENIAFGLKIKKMSPDVIEQKVMKMLKLIGLEGYENKNTTLLSGGQQQRVALARALVIKPDVLLMDEPLSNLDAKLRLEMRQAIRDIQREVGITTVYVTHDQEEAMSISDTIAVMKDGKIQHLGSPRQIYQRPANLFVATFIGRTNVLPATIQGGRLTFPCGYCTEHDSWKNIADQEVRLSVRPEEFLIGPAGGEGIPGTVIDSIYLGLNTHYIVDIGLEERIELIQESTIDDAIVPGTGISLQVKKEKINLFDAAGDRNLLLG